MSVDYEIYMSNKFPLSRADEFNFFHESADDGVVRGYIFSGLLFFAIAENHPEDAFVREEVGFLPVSRLILSPELNDYENSMRVLMKVISVCVEVAEKVKVYQNNEFLLLEKTAKEVVIFNKKGGWWGEYLQLLKFDYVER